MRKTHSLISKLSGARTEYQSLRENGSMVRFLRPFLPLERRLFFPTAMLGGCVMSDYISRRRVVQVNYRGPAVGRKSLT